MWDVCSIRIREKVNFLLTLNKLTSINLNNSRYDNLWVRLYKARLLECWNWRDNPLCSVKLISALSTSTPRTKTSAYRSNANRIRLLRVSLFKRDSCCSEQIGSLIKPVLNINKHERSRFQRDRLAAQARKLLWRPINWIHFFHISNPCLVSRLEHLAKQ